MNANAKVQDDIELWSINEIAEFTKLKPSTIRQKEVIKPDFPRRINEWVHLHLKTDAGIYIDEDR